MKTQRDAAVRFLSTQQRVLGVLPTPNDLPLMNLLTQMEASVVFAAKPRTREALHAMHMLGCRFYPEKICSPEVPEHHWHFRSMPSSMLAQAPVDGFFLIGMERLADGRLVLRRGWHWGEDRRPGPNQLQADYQRFVDMAKTARVVENRTLRWKVRNDVR